ncbi:MAG: iron-sulfur cluster assembly scaffold protein [Acidobacteriota bacterium]|nr:iron-sulfur cluster assembly scaffold protein [Acidobacteriota bacterium]
MATYSSQLLDHFEHPRNVGEIEAADAVAEVENPACGDIMRLSLKLDGGRITQARFRTRGCVPSIACGSALTEMLQGKSVAEARALRREDLVAAVGGLENTSQHASHLAMDALAAALAPLALG